MSLTSLCAKGLFSDMSNKDIDSIVIANNVQIAESIEFGPLKEIIKDIVVSASFLQQRKIVSELCVCEVISS